MNKSETKQKSVAGLEKRKREKSAREYNKNYSNSQLKPTERSNQNKRKKTNN